MDAIYTVRQEYMLRHADLRFVDYRQIYTDFDLELGEKLIDKCLVIAPRIKETSLIHAQNPNEVVIMPLIQNQEVSPEENFEDHRLIQMYLMNQELS